jgi:hypothetical protein
MEGVMVELRLADDMIRQVEAFVLYCSDPARENLRPQASFNIGPIPCVFDVLHNEHDWDMGGDVTPDSHKPWKVDFDYVWTVG